MNSVMIDLMRGCLLVLVVVFIGGGAFIGFAYVVGNPYTPTLFKVIAIGGGALVGLIFASIVTGICYLLLNINDNLERLADATAEGNPDH
nr:hypothetical protein [uncultured Vibrio sp.]